MQKVQTRVLFLVTGQEWITNPFLSYHSHWNFINILSVEMSNEEQEQHMFSVWVLSGPKTEVSLA